MGGSNGKHEVPAAGAREPTTPKASSAPGPMDIAGVTASYSQGVRQHVRHEDRPGLLGRELNHCEVKMSSLSTAPTHKTVSTALANIGESASRRQSAFLSTTLAIEELRVDVRRCADIVDPNSEAHRQFLDIFNASGVCVLACSQAPANLRELKPLFGEVVPHELAEDGIVTIDPTATKCSKNVRDTDAEHELHTDESYSDRPGLLITMQCDYPAAVGGENVFVSAKAMHDAAEKALAPHEYEALFEPCLTVARKLPGSDLQAESTFAVFRRCSNGFVHVRWRHDGYVRCAEESARPGLEFLTNFVKDTKNRFVLKLEKNQVVLIDNAALLHGRLPYDRCLPRRHLRINYFNNSGMQPDMLHGFLQYSQLS